jgi:2-oxoglutarate ferredoxin oxidoreductase subunit beta
VARPDLSVWVVGGDGDMLSIGGNHLLHALRRNVDIKILCFNNRIYGLTKGQYSPTSPEGMRTASTPMGSIDRPINPISVALAAEATFVARTADIFNQHLQDVLFKAAEHRGSCFVEILQNCVIFNDGAWTSVTDRVTRDDHLLHLEHGKPLVFGKERDKGIQVTGVEPRVVTLGQDGITEKDLLVHDETDESMGYLLSRMDPALFPTPIGVFRREAFPSYEVGVAEQIARMKKTKGEGDLMALIHSGDVWEVSA